MKKAVIYARYSSDKQTEDSIEAQKRACADYAAAKGYLIIGEYIDEAISGKGSKTASRTQYQKLLKDCDKGLFDAILIHKYDRIARNLGEHVTLESKLHEKNITLIATAQDFGSSNEAKIMKSLMWALSEYYIDNLADEVKKGHKETALNGLHNGGVAPFGYDVINQKYVINSFEAGFVKKIFQCAAERSGFTDIVREMKNCGVKGKRGKDIKYTQIYEMLRNEKYTGVYIYSPFEEEKRTDRRLKPNAIRIENAFPAIIEKELFERVQKIMTERKNSGKKANYLCSGLVYCSCGAKMHGTTNRGKGHEYKYFVCSKKCGQPFILVDDVDRYVLQYSKDLLSPKNQREIANALLLYQANGDGQLKEFKAVINKKIADKQKEYDNLMQNMTSSSLPAEIIADMGIKMKALKDEIAALENVEPPQDFTVEQIAAWLETIKKAPNEKVIRLLVERIDVLNNKRTDFSITSTLKSVLGKHGCGDSHHILPTILFYYLIKH